MMVGMTPEERNLLFALHDTVQKQQKAIEDLQPNHQLIPGLVASNSLLMAVCGHLYAELASQRPDRLQALDELLNRIPTLYESQPGTPHVLLEAVDRLRSASEAALDLIPHRPPV